MRNWLVLVFGMILSQQALAFHCQTVETSPGFPVGIRLLQNSASTAKGRLTIPFSSAVLNCSVAEASVVELQFSCSGELAHAAPPPGEAHVSVEISMRQDQFGNWVGEGRLENPYIQKRFSNSIEIVCN